MKHCPENLIISNLQIKRNNDYLMLLKTILDNIFKIIMWTGYTEKTQNFIKISNSLVNLIKNLVRYKSENKFVEP